MNTHEKPDYGDQPILGIVGLLLRIFSITFIFLGIAAVIVCSDNVFDMFHISFSFKDNTAANAGPALLIFFAILCFIVLFSTATYLIGVWTEKLYEEKYIANKE
ncbi:MAG: hypothetical protein BGN92_13540 [Sphingobacteriales bacterium 41-5]|nr:MAG: hypothetical protein BGN92_13540 [Sphingobacteriales bacterium 41-5]